MQELARVEDLRPSPRNPRHTPAHITELAESIAKVGLLQPPIVRRLESADGKPVLEIVAGERRRRAIELLGWEHCQVEVRELDDETALDVAVIENLQRDDIHPLEEAEAFEAMQEAGRTAEQIAAAVGKRVDYVYGRLRLTGLCERAREIFWGRRLTLAAAAALARADHKTQQEALKHLEGISDEEDSDPLATRDVLDELEHAMRDLSDVRFALDVVVEGADAPPCMKCPQRSGAQTALFADGLEGEMLCGDAECFKAKNDAHWKATSKAHKKAGGTAKTKLDKPPGVSPHMWFGGSLHHPDYVQLDAKPYGLRQKSWRTAYRKVHGEDAPPEEVTLTRDDRGIVRELISKKAAKAILAELKPKPERTPAQARWAEEQKAQKRKTKLRKAVAKQLRERLESVAGLPHNDLSLMRMALHVLPVSPHTPMDIQEALANPLALDGGAVRQVFAFLVLGMAIGRDSLSESVACAFDWLGVDVAAILAELEAEL